MLREILTYEARRYAERRLRQQGDAPDGSFAALQCRRAAWCWVPAAVHRACRISMRQADLRCVGSAGRGQRRLTTGSRCGGRSPAWAARCRSDFGRAL